MFSRGRTDRQQERIHELIEQVTRLSSTVQQLQGETSAVRRLLRSIPARTASQVQPVLELSKLSEQPFRSSSFGGMALDTKNILELVLHVLAHRPSRVTEFGSGQSTVWIARALQKVAEETGTLAEFVSLDHDPKYFRQTQEMLRRNQLDDVVDLRLAELEEVEAEGQNHKWYATVQIEDLHDVDLLLVDGPPGWIQAQSRFPSVPLMSQKLTPTAHVFVDDADRDDEHTTIQRWIEAGHVKPADPAVWESETRQSLVHLLNSRG